MRRLLCLLRGHSVGFWPPELTQVGMIVRVLCRAGCQRCDAELMRGEVVIQVTADDPTPTSKADAEIERLRRMYES